MCPNCEQESCPNDKDISDIDNIDMVVTFRLSSQRNKVPRLTIDVSLNGHCQYHVSEPGDVNLKLAHFLPTLVDTANIQIVGAIRRRKMQSITN